MLTADQQIVVWLVQVKMIICVCRYDHRQQAARTRRKDKEGGSPGKAVIPRPHRNLTLSFTNVIIVSFIVVNGSINYAPSPCLAFYH